MSKQQVTVPDIGGAEAPQRQDVVDDVGKWPGFALRLDHDRLTSEGDDGVVVRRADRKDGCCERCGDEPVTVHRPRMVDQQRERQLYDAVFAALPAGLELPE